MAEALIPDYECAVFAGWRDVAGETWRKYIGHEFVLGLEDGSLPKSAFMAYLIQDYIFLVNYSRAWALAVVKAETPAQMRTAAATVNALINEEIGLHIEICAREGISENRLQRAAEAEENIAYTRFVLDTGLSGDLLDMLAALAPCVFGYHEIGLRLAQSKYTCALYREWIDTYSGEDYATVCYQVGALINEVSAARLGAPPESSPRWESLCERFTTATRLEVSFWDMGLRLGTE